MISNPVATVELATQAGCALVIGRYPRFGYDANGGGGRAQQFERFLGLPDEALALMRCRITVASY